MSDNDSNDEPVNADIDRMEEDLAASDEELRVSIINQFSGPGAFTWDEWRRLAPRDRACAITAWEASIYAVMRRAVNTAVEEISSRVGQRLDEIAAHEAMEKKMRGSDR